MTDEPRLSLAALAPAVPFIGLGLVLLGVRTLVYGISESAWPVTVAGAIAVLLGAGLAWFGFRRGAGRGRGEGSQPPRG
ncbi:hypothetical protein [Rhabdothermincola salaria]|uniref:hypothetical protein n=1 Tax=Rhabdothermincola salaria TaxID=2903142 RepID=UPI001E5435DB|nr:hypothetical protein [Rhabdothermincola salaria]MCD9622355.1 hypothetical protein [Rhabdothermincola salaria]